MLRATRAETAKLESWLWGRGDQRPGKRVNVRGSSSSAGKNDSAVYAHWRVRRRGDEAETGWENHRYRWRNTFHKTLENGTRGVKPFRPWPWKHRNRRFPLDQSYCCKQRMSRNTT